MPISDFQTALREAVDAYQAGYTEKNKKMPKHRAIDVGYLRAVLNEEGLTDQGLRKKFLEYIRQLKTGWVIGSHQIKGTSLRRSKLYTLIKTVLDDLNYHELVINLRTEITSLKEKLGHYEDSDFDSNSDVHEMSSSNDLNELRDENRKLHRKIDRLQKKLTQLNDENYRLSVEKARLLDEKAPNPALSAHREILCGSVELTSPVSSTEITSTDYQLSLG